MLKLTIVWNCSKCQIRERMWPFVRSISSLTRWNRSKNKISANRSHFFDVDYVIESTPDRDGDETS